MNCRNAGSWTVRWALSAALIASCSMSFLSACATTQGEREAQSTRFEFGLIGDVPYDGRHEREFVHVMKELNAADLAFVSSESEAAPAEAGQVVRLRTNPEEDAADPDSIYRYDRASLMVALGAATARIAS